MAHAQRNREREVSTVRDRDWLARLDRPASTCEVADALGYSPCWVQRCVGDGHLTPLKREAGTMWFLGTEAIAAEQTKREHAQKNHKAAGRTRGDKRLARREVPEGVKGVLNIADMMSRSGKCAGTIRYWIKRKWLKVQSTDPLTATERNFNRALRKVQEVRDALKESRQKRCRKNAPGALKASIAKRKEAAAARRTTTTTTLAVSESDQPLVEIPAHLQPTDNRRKLMVRIRDTIQSMGIQIYERRGTNDAGAIRPLSCISKRHLDSVVAQLTVAPLTAGISPLEKAAKKHQTTHDRLKRLLKEHAPGAILELEYATRRGVRTGLCAPDDAIEAALRGETWTPPANAEAVPIARAAELTEATDKPKRRTPTNGGRKPGNPHLYEFLQELEEVVLSRGNKKADSWGVNLFLANECNAYWDSERKMDPTRYPMVTDTDVAIARKWLRRKTRESKSGENRQTLQ